MKKYKLNNADLYKKIQEDMNILIKLHTQHSKKRLKVVVECYKTLKNGIIIQF